MGVKEYADALAANGHSVEKVVAERIGSKLGHVIVTDAVRLDGERFEGELMVSLYADRAEGHPVVVHGVDVHSRAGHEFSDARESLLDECATTRDEMGDDWVTWTYHSRERDDVDDNVADLRTTYRSVFDGVEGEPTQTSP